MTKQRWAVLVSLLTSVAVGCSGGDPGGDVGPSGSSAVTGGASSDDSQPESSTPDTATPDATAPAASPTAGAATDSPSDAEPWGDLRGQFVYAGASPPPRLKLSITKDQQFCGLHDLMDESVIVNPENSGLFNVVVFLYPKRGQEVPIHPSFEETATAQVELNNENCRFSPHVCLLRTSQTLVVGNKDTVGHNTKVDTLNNSPINPITPAGDSFEHQFTEEERTPMSVGCSIHPWMNGWLLIRDNPYFAVSDEDGNFEIKNVPAGEWTFQVWQEKAQSITEVTLNGATTSWSRGRMPVTIVAGQASDLGKIEVASSVFE